MDAIKAAFGAVTIADLLIFCAALAAMLGLVYRVYKRFDAWYKSNLSLQERINSIARHDEEIETLKLMIIELRDESREYRRTSLQDKIFRIHQTVTQQGYITRAQLDNFQLCLDRYFKIEGNGTVKNKYAAEVFELEVKEH